MPDVRRESCPKCGKPMLWLTEAGGKPAQVLKCLTCDKVDPLHAPQAQRWANSQTLKAPAENK